MIWKCINKKNRKIIERGKRVTAVQKNIFLNLQLSFHTGIKIDKLMETVLRKLKDSTTFKNLEFVMVAFWSNSDHDGLFNKRW